MIGEGKEPMRGDLVLREQLNEALRTATETDDRCAMAIVRLIHAALKERDQQSRANGHPGGLSDQELIAMLRAMVAQRSERSGTTKKAASSSSPSGRPRRSR